jgi:hypothetical protein
MRMVTLGVEYDVLGLHFDESMGPAGTEPQRQDHAPEDCKSRAPRGMIMA